MPIVIVDDKEMWEREKAQEKLYDIQDKLSDLGIADSSNDDVPFYHSEDEMVPYVFEMDDVDIFYRSSVYFNDIKIHGVRARLEDKTWLPIFAIKFETFEKIWLLNYKGLLLQYIDEGIINKDFLIKEGILSDL